jgi:hypothetical protein
MVGSFVNGRAFDEQAFANMARTLRGVARAHPHVFAAGRAPADVLVAIFNATGLEERTSITRFLATAVVVRDALLAKFPA